MTFVPPIACVMRHASCDLLAGFDPAFHVGGTAAQNGVDAPESGLIGSVTSRVTA